MSNSLYNMLTSIKNGQISKKKSILVKKTKFCEIVLKALWTEGYILGYSDLRDCSGKLEVFLKYTRNGSPSITSIKALSKPSRRLYFSLHHLWKLESNQFFILLSTSRGIKSLSDCKRLNIGGEPLFIVK